MENSISALILKALIEKAEHLNEETKSEESAEPTLDLYKDDMYLYGLVKEQGGEKVLEDFFDKVADEYGLEAEPTVYASNLIRVYSTTKSGWNSVSNIIHCVLNYIEEYNKLVDEDEDEEDEFADENSDECKCECGNNECKNCESTVKSGNIQTITFTTKSGQVFGCCTDEDITSIKVVSSNGKMSIFNL